MRDKPKNVSSLSKIMRDKAKIASSLKQSLGQKTP